MNGPATTREPAPFAQQLADLLVPLQSGGDPALLRATVALLCQERDQGNVCVLLRDWQGKDVPGHAPFPAAAAWREQLAATGLCSDGEAAAATPLVLRPDDRLYLLRHFRIERTLATALRTRLGAPPLLDTAQVQRALGDLGWLPATPPLRPDWQLASIALAAHRSFAVLCGGPGTGKTTTVARVLKLLHHLDPQLRMALAAPTGKAASRMGEALRASGAANVAGEPTTLHRLLGYFALDDSFHRGADRQLQHDVVVVDEASMVDPAIFAVLLDALRPDARLLLVGDKDQLAAIAAGQVLGELCRRTVPGTVGPRLAAFVRAATGMDLPVLPDAPPIADATVALVDNHRFGAQPGIGAFATALANHRAEPALAALAHGHADLQHTDDPDAALQSVADALVAAASAGDPVTALQRLATVRILCAARHGPRGTESWNARVETLLQQRGFRLDGPLYPGRPVLVTANDHQSKIWNGDLGVLHPDDKGRLVAWFARPDGPPRAIPPARLPPHETAWAMTVHKAQGSEFDVVLVSLPDRPGPLWQASLVYTAVTRARRRAVLLADPALLPAALANWPTRSSGLAAALAT